MKNNFASARSIGHGGGYVGVNGVGRDRDFCGGGSQYQGGTSYDTEEYHGSLGKGGYGNIGIGGGGVGTVVLVLILMNVEVVEVVTH